MGVPGTDWGSLADFLRRASACPLYTKSKAGVPLSWVRSLMTRTFHLLPFDRLSPADFERLCLWLVRREGYEQVEHVGLSGMDRGCDLVARRNGRRIGFQCKRSGRFGPAAAEAAVAKALSSPWHLDEIVLLVTSPVSAGARERARAKAGSTPCRIWGLSELDERVNRYPELLGYFFGPESLLACCAPRGVPIETVAAFKAASLLLACYALHLKRLIPFKKNALS